MMDRAPTLLDDIYVGEVEDITFPCARSLKAGETIADATITCARVQGAPDENAAQRASTPRQIVGSDVIQRITGVVGGCWYLLAAEVTLTSGRKLVGLGLFQGRTRGS